MTQEPHTIRFSNIGETLEVPVINQLMAIPLEKPGILSLAAGFTDNLALPVELTLDIISKLPETNPNNEFLQYGTTQGRPELRKRTADRLNSLVMEDDRAFAAEDIVVCNGSQQALFLATQTLCNPGDIVLVENPSYFVYLSMLQSLQVNPVGIPVDESGKMDFDAFAILLDQLKSEGKLHKVKAAYLMGYHANPSSRCLSLEEKQGFASTLKKAGLIVPVIEDAAYRDLAFESMDPTPSIMSLRDYEAFPRLYLGTYTKPYATGLKIGYGCCSHKKWLEKILCAKGNQDFGTSNFSQAIIERALIDNRYEALTRELGSHYGKKAELLHEVLENAGIRNKGWHWDKPTGGLLFWMKAPESVNTDMGKAFCLECEKQGVIYVPGSFCFANQEPHNFIRLSIGALPDEKLVEASKRFCKVIHSL